MPIIKLSPEQVAVARVLVKQGQWTHARVADLFDVERATITYALNRRKTMLPAQLERWEGEMTARIMLRSQQAAQRAVAAELRAIAAELEVAI